MREAYFHEDDYCQIELLPLVNWEYCASQLEVIDKSSRAHSQRTGWDTIHIKEQNPQRILSLNISVDALTSTIKPILAPYDRVLTGYSSYREEAKQTLAFGTEAACILFAGYDGQAIIEDIWLDLGLSNTEGMALAFSGLVAMVPLGDFLLVDWSAGGLIDLANPDNLQAYLDGTVKQRATASQAIRNWVQHQNRRASS